MKSNKEARVKAGFTVPKFLRASVTAFILSVFVVLVQSTFPVVAFDEYQVVQADENEVRINVQLMKLRDYNRLHDTEIFFGRTDHGRFRQIEGAYEAKVQLESRDRDILNKQDLGTVYFNDTNTDVIEGRICSVLWMLQHTPASTNYDHSAIYGKKFNLPEDTHVQFTVLGEYDVCN